jgi:hypothetical protein
MKITLKWITFVLLTQNLQNNKQTCTSPWWGGFGNGKSPTRPRPPLLVGAKEWSRNKQNAYLNIKYKLQNMHLGSNLCAIPNHKLSSWPTRGSKLKQAPKIRPLREVACFVLVVVSCYNFLWLLSAWQLHTKKGSDIKAMQFDHTTERVSKE